MSKEQNKLVIAGCFRAYSDGNLDVLKDAAASDYVYFDPAQPNVHTWPEHQAQLSALRRAVPDLKFDIDEMVAEGDRVAVRWTMHGTHQGELLGLPATGKAFETKGHSLYHLVEGKVATAYALSDLLGLKRQLSAGKA